MELLIVIVIAIAFLAGFITWLKLKKEPEEATRVVGIEPNAFWRDAYEECIKLATDAFVRGDEDAYEAYTKRSDEALKKFKEEIGAYGK